jgi:hypothetical protein
MSQARRYRYLGPAELRTESAPADLVAVGTRATLDKWLAERDLEDLTEPFTFIVDLSGVLWLAARRTEHVACAGGQDVLAAGEMAFAHSPSGWSVHEVSNQSTGYCPNPDSWPAVADALDRVGVPHLGSFTYPVTFRRCPSCAERNIVRDGDFTCAVCDSVLPTEWNFAED